MYIFSKSNRDTIGPYEGLNIHLGDIKNGFQDFPHHRGWFLSSQTSLRNIHTYILKKNTYSFLKVNQDPIRLYYIFNIHLGNIRKWFEPLPHPKFQFGTSRTSLRKIHTFITKICIFFKNTKWDLPLDLTMS